MTFATGACGHSSVGVVVYGTRAEIEDRLPTSCVRRTKISCHEIFRIWGRPKAHFIARIKIVSGAFRTFHASPHISLLLLHSFAPFSPLAVSLRQVAGASGSHGLRPPAKWRNPECAR